MKDGRLSDEQLKRAHEKWWPDLRATLTALPEDATPAPQRQLDEMVQEMLGIVRELSRRDSGTTAEEREMLRFMKAAGFSPVPSLSPTANRKLSLADRFMLHDEVEAVASPSPEPPEGDEER